MVTSPATLGEGPEQLQKELLQSSSGRSTNLADYRKLSVPSSAGWRLDLLSNFFLNLTLGESYWSLMVDRAREDCECEGFKAGDDQDPVRDPLGNHLLPGARKFLEKLVHVTMELEKSPLPEA